MFQRVCLQPLYFLFAFSFLTACSEVWNNPHNQEEQGIKVYYSNFVTAPKNLDPARNYSAEESIFNEQIYDPPLRYHYLKRPYELEPNTLVAMPKVSYLDENLEVVDKQSSKLLYSRYEFEIKPNIYYQPHPAFAKDEQQNWRYNFSHKQEAKAYKTIKDFKYTGTQELVAQDYVYQIKRLADPALLSPIRELLSEYIVGMRAFSEQLTENRATSKYPNDFVDLRNLEFEGVKAQGKYRFSILLKGRYPQFKYWLAQDFFAPIPFAVDRFYNLVGLKENNISLSFYPVGTGAFMLTEHNPKAQIVLEKNPNFREEYYPNEGEAEDKERGLLKDAGKPLPLIDKAVYRLEKEALPIWSKFLQGYYDRSGIGVDSFDQAINVSSAGIDLAEELKERGIYMQKALLPIVYYMAFNMLDDVVGHQTNTTKQERVRKLRQAISIAYNEEEYISIFANGRGVAIQSMLPLGIFGSVDGEAGINPYSYDWINNKAQKKPIEVAKKLMAEAGYPNGRDEKTGEPLVLNLDSIATSNGRYPWMKKQFKKLGIELNVRATDYNRFREKMQTGNAQIFESGWGADYPDPENFLFLFYSKNSQVKTGGSGVNAGNYVNAEYDKLFDKMKLMDDTQERFLIVQKMLDILRKDAVVASGFNPYAYALNNKWVSNLKSHAISKRNLQYYNLDPKVRAQYQAQWNKPSLWPLFITALFFALLMALVFYLYQARQKQRIKIAGDKKT